MWQEVDNQLYRKFEFKDFAEAFDFIKKVAELAEEANHHPTIRNTWNTVELWLSTHDAGNTVTDKDRNLAHQVDNILKEKT